MHKLYSLCVCVVGGSASVTSPWSFDPFVRMCAKETDLCVRAEARAKQEADEARRHEHEAEQLRYRL